MSRCPKYRSGPKSPPLGPPTMPREPASGSSADHRRVGARTEYQPLGRGIENQRVGGRKVDVDGLPGGICRRGTVLEDAHIPDIGLDDIKDFAPHRLDLRDPSVEARVFKVQVLRPQSQGD